MGEGPLEPVEADALPLLVPSARCIVTLRADGLQIQQHVESPPIYIGLTELLLLSYVDEAPLPLLFPYVRRVAAQLGVEEAAVDAAAKRLRYAGTIIEGAPASHRAVVDRPSGPVPEIDASSDRLSVRTPVVFRLVGGRFEVIDHGGARIVSLTPAQVHALSRFVRSTVPATVIADLADGPAIGSVDEPTMVAMLADLLAAGLLTSHGSDVAAPVTAESQGRETIIRDVFDRHAAAQDAAEAERRAATGRRRTKVIPVAFDMGTPAGLGMVVAYAKAFDGGRLDELFDFRTDWVWSDDRLEQFTAEPAIYLFSNYLWSHERCIAVSAAVKERSPGSITVHGGPDTPKYEADSVAYFATHPHVDVTIRGEGEVTAAEVLAALAGVIGDDAPDLSVLDGIEGTSYRRADGSVARNPDRTRVTDLDQLPSPFLTGLFDVFTDVPDLFVTLETNRGCPYSCTFCDWGSATNSRVRQFDMERVGAEIEWCARNRVNSINVADANFGMWKRDVEIAQKVADVRRETGYPEGFGVSYAKNTVKHLQQIIIVLADAGIVSQGVLSLQTMDEHTLEVIRRSNIKTERYDALADEMRRRGLPLMVELMMGLPGQTLESFAEDLQQCINREVPARVNHTTLLVNSPMNDPDYLAANQIETSVPVGPGSQPVVLSTSSFTRADYDAMENLRLSMLLFENWGVLRQVSRFVRHETGMREIDVYRAIREVTERSPERWPALFALSTLGTSMMTAPYSWSVAIDELRDVLVADLGVPDGSALDAVLTAQLALLPAIGRSFPETVEVPHDVVAWHHEVISAKGSGHAHDWPSVVPHLSTFGPGSFAVDDPEGITTTRMGVERELAIFGVNWELDSPFSRARIAAGQMLDWVTDNLMKGGERTLDAETSVAIVGSR